MYEILRFLHLLAAIFTIGPLVHAATTAARGVRSGDPAATAAAARSVKIYSYASVAVVIFGFGLMSMQPPWGDEGDTVASFGEAWIWLSVLLWVAAVALALFLLAPTLERATAALGGGEKAESLTGRVAATGGVVALLYLVIVVLMVWQPGA